MLLHLASIMAAATAAADVPWKVYPEATAGGPPPAPAAFRFASSQGDNMVLQQSPAQATVWGFVAAGKSVSVSFQGQSIAATTSTTWMGQSTWIVKLPATNASLTEEHNITATSDGTTITLSNVLFGDVWVCSGQSNMAYPIGSPTCWNASNINCTDRDKSHNTAQCGYGCSQNAGEEIIAMANFPNMRLYENEGGGSSTPLAESRNSGWKLPKDFGGGFSAMCWYFGRDLYVGTPLLHERGVAPHETLHAGRSTRVAPRGEVADLFFF